MLFFKSIFNRTKKGAFDDFRITLESRNELVPEDIFSDASTQFSHGAQQEKKLEIPIRPAGIFIFFSFIFGSLLLFGSYVSFLILTKGALYSQIARNNSQQVYEINPPRGKIISRDNVILASSETLFTLVVNPSQLAVEDVEVFSQQLTSALGQLSYESVVARIKNAQEKNLGELILMKNVTEQEIVFLTVILKEYPPVTLRENPVRLYPEGNLFSHLIGYTASITEEELISFPDYEISDFIGKGGLEYYFEKWLRGEKGLFAKIVTSRGEVSNEKMLQQSQEGLQLNLSIDSKLQQISYDVLLRALRENNLRGGAVVALDPRSGAILALVSLPDFDPNDFTRGLSTTQADAYFNNTSKPLFNRALAGEYPSASVVKPLIAAAALEEDIIDSRKNIYTEGFISVPSVYDSSIIYTFLDWKNHGWVDMRRALAVSSNVYFYMLGGGYREQEGLGIEKIKEYLIRFGWGRVLGINFGTESGGLVPSPQWKQAAKSEEWTIGDTYNTSIGQGDILVTPLQVAASTAVFANEGTLYKPYVVESISLGYQDVKKYEPIVLNNDFISSSTAKVVREGMREAVVSGSSIYLSQLPQPVAGKTGSAQAPGGEPHAWFSGFGPYSNPSIVVTVLLEHGENSSNAVHAAHDIFDYYFNEASF